MNSSWKLEVTRSVKLLGITVDNELKFEKHVKTLCQKVCKKVSAFSRVAPYMDEKIIAHLSGCFAVKLKTKK